MKPSVLVTIFFNSIFLFACQNSSNSGISNSDEAYVSMEGKQVYDMYCVACHGADGKMMFSGATDLSQSNVDLATRIVQIKNGKGVMNAFKGILNDEEIENVAVYIEDLREL